MMMGRWPIDQQWKSKGNDHVVEKVMTWCETEYSELIQLYMKCVLCWIWTSTRYTMWSDLPMLSGALFITSYKIGDECGSNWLGLMLTCALVVPFRALDWVLVHLVQFGTGALVHLVHFGAHLHWQWPCVKLRMMASEWCGAVVQAMVLDGASRALQIGWF